MSNKVLEIKKENAVNAFNTANDEGKKLLTTLFGNDVFSLKITDRVKSFEDACKIVGVDAGDYEMPTTATKDDCSINAYAKLIIIAKALNEGWQPSWEDTNQYKYYPYFKHKNGFGLSYDGYGYWATCTYVGSRLCFKNSELAEYAGTQFENIYNTFLSL
jgi:hypothetical protein